MAYENEVVQEITGKTYDECRQKLFKLYEHDYQIVNKKGDIHYCSHSREPSHRF